VGFRNCSAGFGDDSVDFGDADAGFRDDDLDMSDSLKPALTDAGTLFASQEQLDFRVMVDVLHVIEIVEHIEEFVEHLPVFLGDR